MGAGRDDARIRRAGSIVGFALLFCLLLAAVPVFAESEPQPAPGAGSAQVGGDPGAVPGVEDMLRAEEELERAERQRAEELASPAAIAERKASETAFADAGAAEAEALFTSTFADQLQALDADPARQLSDVELIKVFGESSATISDEGDGALLEAGIPVRAEDEEGKLSKVELGLQATASGFEPANPLTPVVIPANASEVVSVGAEGLGIAEIGARETAQAKRLGDKDVYFHEVEKDTDLVISVMASGVELFDQLRSAESPEMLRFHVDLPQGAELHAIAGGGAAIVENDETTAVIPPPTAVDARGTDLPVEMGVEGATLTVSVPHRGQEYQYPILVDPAIHENYEASWYWGGSAEALAAIDTPGVWQYGTNDPTETVILHNTFCLRSSLCSPSGRGLFISSLNRNIPAGVYAHWYYTVPGATTFIPSIFPEPSAAFNPFWRNNNGCNWENYPEPHDYDGAFDAAGAWTYFETDRAQWVGAASVFTKAKGVAFGISSGGGVNIPCWRDLMVGGVAVRLDDPEAPTISSVSGFPTGWIGSENAFTVTANVSDPGLGVRNAKLAPEGAPLIFSTPPQNECPGTKTHPCPASRAAQFKVSAGLFDEGEKGVQVSAYDPTGKTSPTQTFKVKVDRTPPEVTLGGQLAVVTEETGGDAADPEKWDELSLPVYNLKIDVKDGSNATPATRRSGVKSIEVFLDGRTTPEQVWTQTCPEGSCAMTRTFPLRLTRLSGGPHTLTVITRDQVGERRDREIEFDYVPATGIKGEYLLHSFPLPDGTGNGEEEKGPELAVNLMNGNLVYHERDVNVEGPAVDLEVERFYNSQLPDSENTEWGDGWTLAQTPELEPAGDIPALPKAELLDSSGAIDGDVPLPAKAGASQFDPSLQAMLTKEADGGYELADESGATDTAVVFDSAGRTEELRTGGYATVEYDYEAGHLAEIAVEDPGVTTATPDQVKVVTEHLPPTYGSSFGTSGVSNSQFGHPADVAIDAEGNVWVVDQDNNRLQKFNAKGEFLLKVGTTGSGNGQFVRPTALAIDAKGNLWVTDAGNRRVQGLNAKGEFLRAFGSAGSGNAQFSGAGPEGIAIDPKGNIWVSDTYGARVQKFSETGSFIKAIGSEQLTEPTGIDVGPSGNIWVADWAAHKVVVFDEGGQVLRQFGSPGTGNGQFTNPDALAIDARGIVWVGDQVNGRVQGFGQDGEYLAQFGSKGSGLGQFSFGYPFGIAADSKGNLWVTDSFNNRVQRWAIPGFAPIYSGSIGSKGAGNGQFANPSAIVHDAAGNLWVLDQNNNRVEKFSAGGEYLAQFPCTGSELAIDSQGNFWVIDGLKIKLVNQKGEILRQFGTEGEGQGQLMEPAGIAVGANGNVLVADSWNGWVQEFSAAGTFVKVLAARTAGPGGVEEPYGLAVGSNGHVWVADSRGLKIVEFTGSGQFVRQFGSKGTGPGQFSSLTDVAVDGSGHVWAHAGGGRVQEFTNAGKFLTQFGRSGSGDGQFSEIAGLVARDGTVWVVDRNNNRVQKWVSFTGVTSREEFPANDDPNLEVSVTSGLVSRIEGAEAGQNTYAYSGGNLTANSGPDGETQYEYTENGLLRKVQLPNGTFAMISYDLTSGRVSSVAVDPAGEAPSETTAFSYSDEPRRTTVIPPKAPAVTYDIGADGSILRWFNVSKAPEFADRAGSLYVNRDTESPIAAGDQNLVIQAHSEEGIDSIQVIANGSMVVDQMSCQQDPETPAIDCVDVPNEWVVNTADLPPGFLYLEVLLTDRIGHVASERFRVNIPVTPPPPLGAPVPPTFAGIRHFREQFGLDLDLDPVRDEFALNDRIFDLIGAWNNPQTPLGEVARSSWERWGVPLRPIDVAELEYRDWFYDINADRIDRWIEETNPSSFAGYYIDHRAGGIMHIGFTADQAEQLASLSGSLQLVAGERLQVYPETPTASLLSVRAAAGSVSDAIESNPGLASLVVSVKVDEAGKAVRVGTPNVAQVESLLGQMLGSGVPVAVEHDAGGGRPLSGRFRNKGRMRAGDFIASRFFIGTQHPGNKDCTAGFGAKSKVGEARGHDVWALFVLTAGHCSQPLSSVYRSTDADSRNEENWREVGKVIRHPFRFAARVRTDAEAIEVENGEIVPQGIFGPGGGLIPTEPAAKARKGDVVCFSGAKTQVPKCGPIVARSERWVGSDGIGRGGYWVEFSDPAIEGDSGAPVWDQSSNASIGLVTAGRPETTLTETLVEPLLPPPNLDGVPGILKHPQMRPMSLVLGG